MSCVSLVGTFITSVPLAGTFITPVSLTSTFILAVSLSGDVCVFIVGGQLDFSDEDQSGWLWYIA